MTLKEYIAGLQQFVRQNPKAVDLRVITSIDDEGNGFNSVVFSPTIGIYDKGTLITCDEYAELDRDPNEENVVCVN